MTTRTKSSTTTPATVTIAPPWPRHAYTGTVTSALPWAADVYDAMIAAGCDIPAGLIAEVQALTTAADWRVAVEAMASTLDATWNQDAAAAARSGQPLPDIEPLVRRAQLLSVRSEVGSRITAVTSQLAAGIVHWLRTHETEIILDAMRPRFDAVIAQATPIAEALPPDLDDDGAALRSGHGAPWVELDVLRRHYDSLVRARSALVEVTNTWPQSDPNRTLLIGYKATSALLNREPVHPIARFAHRVRNQHSFGLWRATPAQVTDAAGVPHA